MPITNTNEIPFVLQVWLAADNYDYIKGKNGKHYVSATTLLKSPKQIILGTRAKEFDSVVDISDSIPARMGDAIHEGIEQAWINNLPQALKNLGQEHLVDRFIVNPPVDADLTGKIPVYIEQRVQKEIGNFVVGGKFDFVAGGVLHDFKSTSVWTWIKQARTTEYIKQGSIYKYLNPERITEDFIRICYVFTDWSKAESMRNKDYPQCKCVACEYPLWTREQTEEFIKSKLAVLGRYWDCEEKDIPDCDDEELWRTQTLYKYYSDPTNLKRATKNFTDYAEAVAFQKAKGVGIVKTVPGEPRACGYCAAAPICRQRRRYDKE